MSHDLTPEEYLRRAFEVIIAEAGQNKRFAKQLLDALGAVVATAEKVSPRLFDPRVEIQNRGVEQTRAALSKMTVNGLRQICNQFGYDDGPIQGNRKQPFIELIVLEAQSELERR